MILMSIIIVTCGQNVLFFTEIHWYIGIPYDQPVKTVLAIDREGCRLRSACLLTSEESLDIDMETILATKTRYAIMMVTRIH